MMNILEKLNLSKQSRIIAFCIFGFFLVVLAFLVHPTLTLAGTGTTSNPATSFNPPTSLAKIYEVLGTNNGGVGHEIRSLWITMMGIVNSLIVLVLLFVAFAEILRLNVSTYGIKKILPTLVLAVLAANFSYILCRFIVDVANVMLTLFLSDTNTKCITEGIKVSKFFHADIESIIKDLNANKAGGTSGGLLTALALVIFSIVAAVITLVLAFLFTIRNYIIYLLVIVAPIGFMAMALPQTKTYFGQWWSMMVKWTFMPTVSIAIIWMGGQLLKLSGIGDSPLMGMVLSVAFLVLAIQVPFKLGGPIMQKWGDMGKKAWGSTGGAAANKWGSGIKDYWTNQGKSVAMRGWNNWRMTGLNMVRKGNGFQRALGNSFLFGSGGDKAKANVKFEEDFAKGLTEGIQARHYYKEDSTGKASKAGKNLQMRREYRANRAGEEKEYEAYAKEDIMKVGATDPEDEMYTTLKAWRASSGHARQRMAIAEQHMNDLVGQGTFASIQGYLMKKEDQSEEEIRVDAIKNNPTITDAELNKIVEETVKARKERDQAEYKKVLGMNQDQFKEWSEFQIFVNTEKESTNRLKEKAEKDQLVKPTMDQLAIHEQAELSQETKLTTQKFKELSDELKKFANGIQTSGRKLSEMTQEERNHLQSSAFSDDERKKFSAYLNNQGRATVRLREMGVLNENEEFRGSGDAHDSAIAKAVETREAEFIEKFIKGEMKNGKRAGKVRIDETTGRISHIPAHLRNLVEQDADGNIKLRRMDRTTYTRGLAVANDKTKGRVADYSAMTVDTLINLLTAGDKKDSITAEDIQAFRAGHATSDTNKRSRMMAMIASLAAKLDKANEANPAAEFIISGLSRDETTGTDETQELLSELEKSAATGAAWSTGKGMEEALKAARDASAGDITEFRRTLTTVYATIPQNQRGTVNSIIRKFVRTGSY
ncbi:MAG: hypothetical protein WC227_00475 [Patescibacteria group bacterium]|jgi:hypothetical protein